MFKPSNSRAHLTLLFPKFLHRYLLSLSLSEYQWAFLEFINEQFIFHLHFTHNLQIHGRSQFFFSLKKIDNSPQNAPSILHLILLLDRINYILWFM